MGSDEISKRQDEKRKKVILLRTGNEPEDISQDVLSAAGEALDEALSSALSNREHVVMVRVNTEILEKLDLLVKSGICSSRSGAAAFVLREGIQANTEFFDSIEQTTRKMAELKEDLMRKARPASGTPPTKEENA